jgi:hypothetical protein
MLARQLITGGIPCYLSILMVKLRRVDAALNIMKAA